MSFSEASSILCRAFRSAQSSFPVVPKSPSFFSFFVKGSFRLFLPFDGIRSIPRFLTPRRAGAERIFGSLRIRPFHPLLGPPEMVFSLVFLSSELPELSPLITSFINGSPSQR